MYLFAQLLFCAYFLKNYLFDYSYKEFTNKKIEFTDEYIITPNVSGPYIFVVKAIYEGKDIEYYFMVNINEINVTDVEVIMQLKENTLSSTGLTMILKNQSNVDLQYGNPYSIENKFDNKKIFILNDVRDAFPLMNKLQRGDTYVLLENDLPDLFNE